MTKEKRTGDGSFLSVEFAKDEASGMSMKNDRRTKGAPSQQVRVDQNLFAGTKSRSAFGAFSARTV